MSYLMALYARILLGMRKKSRHVLATKDLRKIMGYVFYNIIILYYIILFVSPHNSGT